MYIAYSDNVDLLIHEVETVAPEMIYVDSTGKKKIGRVKRTPIVRNGDESMSVLLDVTEEMMRLDHLTIIGRIEKTDEGYVRIMGSDEISEDEANEIYDRVYPRKPTTVFTDNGPGIEQRPPDLFGVIAS